MKLNLESIKTRLERLNLYIEELEKRQKLSLSDYNNSTSEQMVVERGFQAAIECCADIASHVVSVYKLGRPIEQRDVFGKLSEAGYIDKDYGMKMGQLVVLRNRIVHMYWDIDAERMYQYLQEDISLLKDFATFTLQLIEAESATDS